MRAFGSPRRSTQADAAGGHSTYRRDCRERDVHRDKGRGSCAQPPSSYRRRLVCERRWKLALSLGHMGRCIEEHRRCRGACGCPCFGFRTNVACAWGPWGVCSSRGAGNERCCMPKFERQTWPWIWHMGPHRRLSQCRHRLENPISPPLVFEAVLQHRQSPRIQPGLRRCLLFQEACDELAVFLR